MQLGNLKEAINKRLDKVDHRLEKIEASMEILVDTDIRIQECKLAK